MHFLPARTHEGMIGLPVERLGGGLAAGPGLGAGLAVGLGCEAEPLPSWVGPTVGKRVAPKSFKGLLLGPPHGSNVHQVP